MAIAARPPAAQGSFSISECHARWASASSISTKIGCWAHRLLERVKRAGVTSDMAKKLKALERENRELRETYEILCKALGYFVSAQHISPKAGSTTDSIHDRKLMKFVTIRA
ncbi:MAG: hypothetical protein ING02_04575 [Roseomonas sp.]|nr:hypothetical protein [Roseomonas sp.]